MKLHQFSLSRDNFVNLMFWVGMTLGMVLAECFSAGSTTSFVILWTTLLLVPYFTKMVQAITFLRGQGFFARDGRSLQDSYPSSLGWVFALTILILIILGAVADELHLNMETHLASVVWSIFFLIPTLYFMKRNCPIAILFNLNAWRGGLPNTKRVKGSSFRCHNSSSLSASPSHSSTLTPEKYFTQPGYRHLGGNIHHRK